MDFKWVVDALRRGLKVTRTAWAGDPPMYLYTSKTKNGKHTVMVYNGSTVDREACFYPDAVLDATDWEEYVEPKKESSVKAVEDQTDYAKEARKIVDGLPEDYYKVQLIDALVDAFVDKISQRVARLLK